MKNKLNRFRSGLRKVAVGAAVVGAAAAANAQSDVGSIVTAASTTFGTVATVCVTMGIFFIGYRIAKRIR